MTTVTGKELVLVPPEKRAMALLQYRAHLAISTYMAAFEAVVRALTPVFESMRQGFVQVTHSLVTLFDSIDIEELERIQRADSLRRQQARRRRRRRGHQVGAR